jgi:hypothetical protein
MRSYCGAAVVVIPAVALLGGAYSSPADAPDLARVTGRATCGGHPLRGMRILFQPIESRGHGAVSSVMADGSYRIETRQGTGLFPGAYRVHFFPSENEAPDPSLDPKYMDSRTSGLEVRIGPGWNEIVFSLPGPDRDPTVVRHRRGQVP